MRLTDECKAVLQAMSVSGAVTVTEFTKQFPQLPSPKPHMEHLYSHGLLNAECAVSQTRIYSISAKGKRLLERDSKYVGQIPTPKYRPPHEPLVIKPSTPVRPGADDHLNHPSLRGDVRVMHRGPLSLAGGQA